MDLGGGIVAHYEVMPVGVSHLVYRDGFREGKDAPVGEAAHDAFVSEDVHSGCVDDSVVLYVSSFVH